MIYEVVFPNVSADGIELVDALPYYVGCTLCVGLMGALAVQAYIYFTRFSDDQKAIKALVKVVLLLEVLITGSVFSLLLVYGNSTGIAVAAVLSSPAAGLVTTLTHGFYCWRISSLQKSRLTLVLIMMMSLLQLVSMVYFAFTDQFFPLTLTSHNDYYNFVISPWLGAWLGGSVVCDLAITVCMILALRPSKSHFRATQSVLTKLTRFTLETGLVTVVAALLELILALAFWDRMYHIAVFFAVSKLYANCLLATLNFRLVLRSQSDPNMTVIVWDGEAQNMQSRLLSTCTPHAVASVEADIETVICLNENLTGDHHYELLDR